MNVPINVSQIEHDIKALWTKASSNLATDGAVSRACLSNLIIYTEDLNDEEEITHTIAEFVPKHPCRAIMILAQPKSHESKIDVAVSTHTMSVSGSRKSVSCEQITLRASGSSVKEIASAVQPLLVTDLPIYLWWRGVFLTQRVLLEQMLGFVDRFMYDGVAWIDLHDTVPLVADYIEKYKGHGVGFTNFNWSRLRPWREYAADFFDSGMYEKEIWDLNQIRVEFMSLPDREEGYQFRALLFIAWLAVQLEWQPIQGIPGTKLAKIQFLDKKKKPVETELVLLPQTSGMSQGIQRVVMGIQKENRFQDFVVQRDHADHVMILTCQKENQCCILRKVPHIDSGNAELLFRELGRRTRNRVFEKSFKMAAHLIQMI